MTVAELIEELKKYPKDMPVVGHSIGFGGPDWWYNFRPDLIRKVKVLWDKSKEHAMHELPRPRSKKTKTVIEIR